MMKSEIFQSIQEHLMTDTKPSRYIRTLLKEGLQENELLDDLSRLDTIQQNPKYHPEGSVLNHVLEVVDHAAKLKSKSRNPEVMMWAALLHDLGKLTTTKIRKGRITAYGHDEEGALMTRKLLEPLSQDKGFKNTIVALVRWHMQPFFVVKSLPFAREKDMVEETSIEEVALLSLCDRMGRGKLSEENIREAIEIEVTFLEKCKGYMTSIENEKRRKDMIKYLKLQVIEDMR